MRIYVIILVLFLVHTSRSEVVEKIVEAVVMVQSIPADGFKFYYLNSNLGKGNIIEIKYGDEQSIMQHWIKDAPLKLTTHGWDTSVDSKSNKQSLHMWPSVVSISSRWIGVLLPWILSSKYPKPAALTVPVSAVIATFLERVVDITKINLNDIHLIGYGLGAHALGSCVVVILKREKWPELLVSLNAAGPGFQNFKGKVPQLSADDALFVDCIHTAEGTVGYADSLGHVDFFANGGEAPQPECKSIIEFVTAKFGNCSHRRAVELYIDSIYNRRSLIGVSCSSWDDFKDDKCKTNPTAFMGHDTEPSAKGNYYLKTQDSSPFSKN
ncbi:hypothetical protein AGLY_005652 [Aphis glycines]|uniref:Lipase domain-containing protein n=1 Tax=Aphis glycines TaxID=307491 RepID=A0A6G0TVQ4_APHGL|nr:hypothetical protein AGLY_005652 [Aphis glycines]